MPNQFQRLTVEPAAALQVLVMPQFGDVIDETGEVIIASDEQGDWQVWDNVPWRVPVIDIYGNKNLMKRRDATCKIIYSSLATMQNRYLFTEPVYIAAENCQRELYQGAFRDWESRSEIFAEKAVELIGLAAGADVFSNKWFGNVARPANADYSLNKFNGIWHWVAADIAATTIPSSQTVDLGAYVDFDIADAYAALIAMISAQPDIMDNLEDDMKTIQIDKEWARLAWRYLVSIGDAGPLAKADKMPTTWQVEGIEVKPKKWGPIITSIMSAKGHLGILTLKGNFIFGTDSKYGSGPNSDGPAMQVWYSQDDDVTRWQWHLKAGTMLGTPGYAVVASTTGVIAQL